MSFIASLHRFESRSRLSVLVCEARDHPSPFRGNVLLLGIENATT